MKTITYTNDLSKEIEMNSEEFKKVVTEAIEFAVNDKEYNINDLTVAFIAEDITGVIKGFHNTEHKMNEIGLEIIETTLNEMKSNNQL